MENIYSGVFSIFVELPFKTEFWFYSVNRAVEGPFIGPNAEEEAWKLYKEKRRLYGARREWDSTYLLNRKHS